MTTHAKTKAKAAPAVDIAAVFAALGDETRLAIVTRLCDDGPLPIVRLCEGATMSRQAITKHLDALADAGLVRGDRKGRERIWQLEPGPLKVARTHLDRISAHWDEALHRLRALVEDEE